MRGVRSSDSAGFGAAESVFRSSQFARRMTIVRFIVMQVNAATMGFCIQIWTDR